MSSFASKLGLSSGDPRLKSALPTRAVSLVGAKDRSLHAETVDLEGLVKRLQAQIALLQARIEKLETANHQSQPVSKPRETSLRKSQSQKPWEAEGISKASWYRKRKEAGDGGR